MSETRQPCHGCGEKGRRTKDKLCARCQGLLEAGKAVKDEELRKTERGSTFRLSKYWPGIYSPGGDTKSIEKAFQELAQAALKRLKTKQPAYGEGVEAIPPASNRVHYNSYDDGASLWTGSRRLAAAITALDAEVRAAILSAYHEGERNGNDLLMRLAGGHVSVNELTEATIEAGRKKRGTRN